MRKDEKHAKIRRTIYISADVDKWLETQAAKDDRSVSYYLDAKLRRELGPRSCSNDR